MTQILLQVQNKKDLTLPTNEDDSLDFFSMAGIWEDREITLESIRQKAWRGRGKKCAHLPDFKNLGDF